MLRVTASSLDFDASQTDAEAVSSVQNLLDFVDSQVTLNPSALTVTDSIDSTITCTEVVLRSTKNPEVAHRLYKGPAVPVADVLGAFSRDALRNGSLTPLEFTPDHGMELAFTYSSGGTAYSGTLLWDVQNDGGPPTDGVLPAIQQVREAIRKGNIPQHAMDILVGGNNLK